MENNWKDYFTFTKKERIGILLLILLIAITVAIPWFFTPASVSDELTVTAFNAQCNQLEKIMKEAKNSAPRNETRAAYVSKNEMVNNIKPATLFSFDPNTLDENGWSKLGLGKRLVHIILNYRAKGGRFRKPEDLQRIYGIKKDDYEKLLPYVQIKVTDSSKRYAAYTKYANDTKRKAAPAVLDINTADTTAFIALPGIGNRLANRIVNFREKLGGFYSVEQVAETWGLPDSTFQLIKPRLQCINPAPRKININTADVNALRQHPYIRWNIANAIVQFRQQHGPYRSPADLQQITIITPELFGKIVGYVTVEGQN